MRIFFLILFVIFSAPLLIPDAFSQTPTIELSQNPVPINHDLFVTVIDRSVVTYSEIPLNADCPAITVTINFEVVLGTDNGSKILTQIAERNVQDPQTQICDGKFFGHITVITGTETADDMIQINHPLDKIKIRYGSDWVETKVTFDDFAVPTGDRFEFNPTDDNIPCLNESLGNHDMDNDGICDEWENISTDSITIIDTDNPSSQLDIDCVHPDGCDSERPDIFLEIDWMEGHKPDPDAIDLVVNAFSNAGYRLHVYVDPKPAIGHDPDIPYPGYQLANTPTQSYDHLRGYSQIKGTEFGLPSEKEGDPDLWYDELARLKYQVFHYALFVHERQYATNSTGIAEVHGNDIMVSLGQSSGEVGSIQEQAGTLMHELGHNLGLHHGGDQELPQCQPNYFSVMSYSRQFPELDPHRDVDFSHRDLGNTFNIPTLDETDLVESPFGMEPYLGFQDERIIYSCNEAVITTEFADFSPVDWDCSDNPSPISADLNNILACPTTTLTDDLKGHHDWNPANLDLDFSDDSGYDSGYVEVMGGLDVTLFPDGDFRIPPSTNLLPDPGITHIIILGEEMTLHDVTLLRIEKLASLYRDLYAIPPESYTLDLGRTTEIFAQTDDNSSDFLVTASETIPDDQTTQKFQDVMVPNVKDIEFSPKGSFLWSVEHMINIVNHQDLEKAHFKIQWLDFFLWLSLQDDYDRVAHVLDDLKLAYAHSLDFKPTSYHSSSYHQPMLFGTIVSQNIIDTKLQTIREKVDDSGYVPKKYPTDPPSLPPFTWWMWVIVIIIVIVVGIYLWRRYGPNLRL